MCVISLFLSFNDCFVSINGKLFDLLKGKCIVVPHFNVNLIPVWSMMSFAVLFFFQYTLEERII